MLSAPMQAAIAEEGMIRRIRAPWDSGQFGPGAPAYQLRSPIAIEVGDAYACS
jgi:hypothetical protein